MKKKRAGGAMREEEEAETRRARESTPAHRSGWRRGQPPELKPAACVAPPNPSSFQPAPAANPARSTAHSSNCFALTQLPPWENQLSLLGKEQQTRSRNPTPQKSAATGTVTEEGRGDGISDFRKFTATFGFRGSG